MCRKIIYIKPTTTKTKGSEMLREFVEGFFMMSTLIALFIFIWVATI